MDDNEWVDVGEIEISIVGAHTEGDRVVLATFDDNQPSDDDSEDEDFVKVKMIMTLKMCLYR